MRYDSALWLCIAIGLASGCQLPAADPTPRSSDNNAAGQPIAYLNGQAISDRDIAPALYEAVGGKVLEQIILDRLIAEQLSDRGLIVDQKHVEQERLLLSRALGSGDVVGHSADLLIELRRRRGLGKDRFAALLRRNASLRMLIADQVQISDVALQQAYQLQYGPRYQCRLIVVATLGQAAALRERIEAGESFSDLAAAHSADSSAARGGLLLPISPADSTYPKAVRTTLTKLQPSQVSAVIALDRGFALIKLERKVPAEAIQLEDVKSQLIDQVRHRTEKMLMQRQAAALLSKAKVVVLDEALQSSWRQRKE